MIEKSPATKKMFSKTFNGQFLGRQSFYGRFFYEYKKVLVSSKTFVFMVPLSEHFKLSNITRFYQVNLDYKFCWVTDFFDKCTFIIKLSFLTFFTKLLFYKTSVLIWRSYKKKLIVFLKNAMRYKRKRSQALSAAETSFLELEI